MYILRRKITKNGVFYGDDLETKPTLMKCQERANYIFKYYQEAWACSFKVEYSAIYVDEDDKTAEFAWEETMEYNPKQARCIN